MQLELIFPKHFIMLYYFLHLAPKVSPIKTIQDTKEFFFKIPSGANARLAIAEERSQGRSRASRLFWSEPFHVRFISILH